MLNKIVLNAKNDNCNNTLSIKERNIIKLVEEKVNNILDDIIEEAKKELNNMYDSVRDMNIFTEEEEKANTEKTLKATVTHFTENIQVGGEYRAMYEGLVEEAISEYNCNELKANMGW